jgi:hypothetical protein
MTRLGLSLSEISAAIRDWLSASHAFTECESILDILFEPESILRTIHLYTVPSLAAVSGDSGIEILIRHVGQPGRNRSDDFSIPPRTRAVKYRPGRR